MHSRALANNVTGDSPDRAVSVYLPPTYQTAKAKLYPVVYLLHGIGDTDAEFTSAWTGNTEDWGTIQGLMNHGIREGLFGEMIIVIPDERTKMGGSFYTNSLSTGNWEDFTVRELVSFIDRKCRTLARRESRGIAGHSMGGYGAVKLGMKHPEILAVLGLEADVSFENPAFASLGGAIILMCSTPFGIID